MLLLMEISFAALTNCDNIVLSVLISPGFLFKLYVTFFGLVLLLTVMLNELSKMTFPFPKTASLSPLQVLRRLPSSLSVFSSVLAKSRDLQTVTVSFGL